MVTGLLFLLATAPMRAAGQAPLLSAEEQALLDHVNSYRIQNGLTPFSVSPTLSAAARWMSQDMADRDYFSHTDSLGRDPFGRMAAFGYDCEAYNTWCGENLAAGSATGSETFELWKGSPGHNANLLNANYRVAGIAAVLNEDSTYRWYWTLELGGFDDSGQAPPTATPSATPMPPSPTPSPPPPTQTPPPSPTEMPPPAPTETVTTPAPSDTVAPPAPTETPIAATGSDGEPTADVSPPAAAPPPQGSGRQFGEAPPTGSDETRAADAPPVWELEVGWNRLEMAGQARRVAEVLPVDDGCLLAVYAWDRGAGVWRRYLPGVGIPEVNTLAEVGAGQTVWILAARPVVLKLAV